MVKADRTVPELAPGTCIGRYRIEKELGRGGESVVYLASDLRLGKRWAVKMLRKREGKGPAGEAGAREIVLSAEAELMKRLDHPALPRIVDILEEGDCLLLIMDYVEGETLAELLKRAGPFPEETVRGWMYRLASVLGYLHGQDPPVIYRDMKPGNVIRKPDGSLVLLDLGIAREYKQDRGQDTTALGTRGYAPPEQYGNAQTDIRSDIYSLGMTAAELLTGCPPGRDPYLYKTHPFRKLHPEISEEFEKILNRCLAFSPGDRYGSCRELMQDLNRVSMRRKRPNPLKQFRKMKKSPAKTFRPGKRKVKTLRAEKKRTETAGPEMKKAGEVRPKRKRIVILAALIALECIAAVLAGGSGKPSVQAEPSAQAEQDPLLKIRGYLDECGREESFSERKSIVLQRMFTELPQEERADGAYPGLCFDAGREYLFSYAGDNGSFRSRVLRAQPFFRESLQYCGKDGAAFEKRVRNYVRLCDFFVTYMFDQEGISEPDRDVCEDVLEAVRQCLDEAGTRETGDGVWLQLLLMQSMESLLREYRQNFADAGIGQETVLEILRELEEKAGAVTVSRETLRTLQADILQSCTECREEIDRTYANIEKWKEAENAYDGKTKKDD